MNQQHDKSMNSDRIKEIQETTAYPNSLSVHQALLQVWNECGQELNRILTAAKCNSVEEVVQMLSKGNYIRVRP